MICNNDDVYDMKGKNLGDAIIFNFINFESNYSGERLPFRKGAEKDAQDLFKILSNFGFNVKVHEDLESREIHQKIQDASEKNHESNNSLLIIVMSHGNENGVIYTNDFKIEVKDFWDPFKNCPSLVGKPKIFFIQACRGKLKDFGAILSEETEICSADPLTPLASKGNAMVRKVPILADILIYFSCAEGFPSFKSKEGTWFIQSICENLKKAIDANDKTDLLTVLLRVNRNIAFSRQSKTQDDYNACKQMPVIVSMLTKTFLLGNEPDSDSE